MKNFEFCPSTSIHFGKDVEKKVGSTLAADGAHTVLIVHDSGRFLYDTGLLDNIKKDLETNGLKWIEYGSVKANPSISQAREAIEVCRKEGVDYVLCIGGGSPIDTGKAVCAGMGYDGDVWDLFSTSTAKVDRKRKTPQAVILTIPATGTEASFSTVMRDDETGSKFGMRGGGNFMRPQHAFMNPDLTLTLPLKMTMAGIVDMFSHIIERYFVPVNYGLIDYMGEGAMRAIKHFAYVIKEDPTNYEARSEIMFAGTVAQHNILGLGRGKDGSTHAIGHEISGLYETVHGITLTVIMPYWMEYVYKADVDRFAHYASEVFGIPHFSRNQEDIALAGVRATKKFYQDLQMPTSFKEAGIPTDQFEEIARRAIDTNGGKPIGAFRPLEYEDVLAILNAAKGE